MATTVLTVISDAMQMIGAYGAGATLSDADSALGLRMLNRQQDMWSNFSLACYEVLEQSAPLVIGQSAYTIGAGGNFNMTRPLKILGSPGTAYVQDGNGNNYNMEVVERAKWNLYANRSPIVTSNFPSVLFYDPQMPLGVINIIPYPTTAYTMFWDSMLQLTQFANLQASLSLPPGYEMAMVSNLAIILHPYMMDQPLNPAIPLLASSSLGAIKRTNQRENNAVYDPEIVSRATVSYNPYTDSVGSSISGN